jgi:hypothetical protein
VGEVFRNNESTLFDPAKPRIVGVAQVYGERVDQKSIATIRRAPDFGAAFFDNFGKRPAVDAGVARRKTDGSAQKHHVNRGDEIGLVCLASRTLAEAAAGSIAFSAAY